MAFQIGEKVKTMVISRSGQPTGEFVLATLLKPNVQDSTWDLQVINNGSSKSLVSKKASHVPLKLIRKLAEPSDVRVLINKGIDPTKAKQILEICNGNLQSALDLLAPPKKSQSGVVYSGEGSSCRDPSGTPPNMYSNSSSMTQKISPEYPYQPVQSGNIYNYEALRTRQKYNIGETVETRIVFQKRSNREAWVTARISKYNHEDNTWDIEVLEPKRHRVHPVAIHVPDHFIRKYQPKEMNNQGFPVGGVSMVNESESDFLPELPDEDFQPPPPPISPPAPGSPISAASFAQDAVQAAKISSIVAAGFTREVAIEALKAAMGDVDFALALLVETNQSSHSPDRAGRSNTPRRSNTEKTWDSPPSPAARGFEPKEDEFDYQMLFPAPRFGFEIAGSSNGKNAIVRACLSDFAIDNVIPCSLIIMVQDTLVIGKQLTEIQDLMKEAMQKESRVKLRFRSKKRLKHQFQKQGTLKIIIVSGQALWKAATHCTIHVRNSMLSSDKVKKDKNPIWNSTLRWREFHPYRVRKAQLKVWCTNTITSNTCIGSAIFELPKDCDTLSNIVVEITKGKQGKTKGLVALKMLLSST